MTFMCSYAVVYRSLCMKFRYLPMVIRDFILSRHAKHLFTDKLGSNYVRNLSKHFIEESNLPTDTFQKSLPYLPISSLDRSLARCLTSQASFVY